MKRIFNLLLIAAVFCGLSSCWKEEIPEAGAARPQIKELKAVPGDEEVQLSWSVPEGYTATDFLIKYTTPQSEAVEIRTGGETECLVTDLQNEYNYKFDVQAVYGELISSVVFVNSKPTTSRFPITNLAVASGDSRVTLTWTKPALTVLSYTLSYNMVDTPNDVKTETLDKDLETYIITGLTNDKNYSFSLTANYTKGAAPTATVKAMPSQMVITTDPYIVDRKYASFDQPVHFSFDRKTYPTVSDVKWTYGETVVTGDNATFKFTVEGEQLVVFSGDFNGVEREWEIKINVRQYALLFTEWAQDGSNCNGFKGSCPVFSPDGKTIYNITFNKVTSLYAFDVETGTEKWHYTPEKAGSYNPLTVNPVTGDIYFGTTAGGQFYAVTADGQLKWMFNEVGSMQSAAPAVSADGNTVFVVDATGSVFALKASDGSKIWGVKPGASVKGGGLLVNGNELIVGLNDITVYFLKIADGSEIASVTLTQKMTDIAGFAVSNDKKTIYVPQAAGCLSSIDLASHKVAVNSFTVGTNNLYEPVVAPNGTIFVGSKDGNVYNVAGDLSKVNWSHTCPNGNNSYNYSHPCVDTDNQFYITAGQKLNHTYIFSAAGEVLLDWSYGSSANQKQMGGNNYLNGVLYSAYIGASGENGAFLGKYVGGERAATWSTHGGDICGSCCIK